MTLDLTSIVRSKRRAHLAFLLSASILGGVGWKIVSPPVVPVLDVVRTASILTRFLEAQDPTAHSFFSGRQPIEIILADETLLSGLFKSTLVAAVHTQANWADIRVDTRFNETADEFLVKENPSLSLLVTCISPPLSTLLTFGSGRNSVAAIACKRDDMVELAREVGELYARVALSPSHECGGGPDFCLQLQQRMHGAHFELLVEGPSNVRWNFGGK